jgi:GBP family porin
VKKFFIASNAFKTLTALTALGAIASAAHAQSSVTLYGLIDAGLTYTNNQGGSHNVQATSMKGHAAATASSSADLMRVCMSRTGRGVDGGPEMRGIGRLGWRCR